MEPSLKPSDFEVKTLGPCAVDSPLRRCKADGQAPDFVAEASRILLSVERGVDAATEALSFERAGPRGKIFFDPARTRAGIVTCGGLCPGINSVVRSLVLELHHMYGVQDILGFRFGYEGLIPERGLPAIALTPSVVNNIHHAGGSILGLGRGAQSPADMVGRLEELGVNLLITIGGDGALKGAHAIADVAARKGVPLSVVGVPKTVDNDIAFVDQTFGFETAVHVASHALEAAHTEATSARNGIGVVKLMGRDAGFISAHAALASLDVNFCLIPEVPFDLEGPGGLLESLEARLLARGHALIAVAEGCGATLERPGAERDASGNLRFSSKELDVGPRLCEAIRAHFAARDMPATVKYIDPSYMIRSVAANPSDNKFCDLLARNAVHAAMAGKTDVVIGRWNGYLIHVPLSLSTTRKKRVHANSELWMAVTTTTGQPPMRRTRAPRDASANAAHEQRVAESA